MMGSEATDALMDEDVHASLLHSLAAQTPALIAIRANDGIYLHANEAFASTLGVPAASVPGRHEDELFHAAGAPQSLRVGNATAEGKVGQREEEAVVGLRPRRFLTTRFPLRTRSGEVFATGMIAVELGARAESGIDYTESRHEELLRALERMERLAYTDRLTGAWNRRHLEDAALLEMSRSERHGHPASLLLLDVDHFKEINDHFGHAVGDYVLVELVRHIRNDIRRVDTITRWGGEEFVVLAPDTPLHEAEHLAEKLCARVAEAQLSSARSVTISVGVAEYQCGEGFEHWLSRADRAMYRAKAGGRNRVALDLYTRYGQDGSRRTGSPVQLVWRDIYRSGNDSVDRQHRQLFDHANALLQAMMASAPRAEILETMQMLVADVSGHFAEEERLHREIGFPTRDTHAAEHSRLLEKAARLLDIARGAAELPVADVFHFLAYEVVAQHIVASDRAYFPYLEKPAHEPDR